MYCPASRSGARGKLCETRGWRNASANAVAYSQDSLVTKVYAGAVVDRLSSAVYQEGLLASPGPNGAGKTTTFNMIRTFTTLRTR